MLSSLKAFIDQINYIIKENWELYNRVRETHPLLGKKILREIERCKQTLSEREVKYEDFTGAYNGNS